MAQRDEVFDLIRRHMSVGLAFAQNMAGRGAVETRAFASKVETSDGRNFVDLGSYGVPILGHGHGGIIEAVQRQLQLQPTSTRLLANPVTARLAEALTRDVGHPRLQRVWFGTTGADVVEASLKAARVATGRQRVIAVSGGFHGKTLGALAVTSFDRYRRPFEGLLGGVTHVDPFDIDAVAREVASGDVAAVIFEPVLGEGGIRLLSPQVLTVWVEEAHRVGAFVIADEVQTGCYRCGALAYSVGSLGLDVDGVLLGKGLGGGVMPMSAFIGSSELLAPLNADPFLHSSTFGGHPLSCAAALAFLEDVDAHGHSSDARRVATVVSAALDGLAAKHPDVVVDVRGVGCMWGIQFTSAELAGQLLVELTHAGVIVSPALGEPTVLRLLPALTIPEADLHWALTSLIHAIATVSSR